MDNEDTLLGEFKPMEEESVEKILVSLLNPENAKTKTELHNPLTLTQLITYGKWLRDEKLFKSANTIFKFVEEYRVNMISFKRQSRTEVIQALSEAFKQERSLQQKLVSPPEKG